MRLLKEELNLGRSIDGFLSKVDQRDGWDPKDMICIICRYEIPNLKEWAEGHLSRLVVKENVGKVFSLAWNYNSGALLHACFKKFKLGSEEVKNTQEWKEIFQGKEEIAEELTKNFWRNSDYPQIL